MNIVIDTNIFKYSQVEHEKFNMNCLMFLSNFMQTKPWKWTLDSKNEIMQEYQDNQLGNDKVFQAFLHTMHAENRVEYRDSKIDAKHKEKLIQLGFHELVSKNGVYMQQIIWDYHNLQDILDTEKVNKVLLVCGNSTKKLPIAEYIQRLDSNYTFIEFHDFAPNPKIESVYAGVKAFEDSNCDFIMAVGGGSSIDVAKCIKKEINDKRNIDISNAVKPIKMLAIPTTAGTGSESTQFAVVYEDGEKKSVDDPLILPEYVILDGSLLTQLPLYQKKATMLDALCQAIESIWARRTTRESRDLAEEALTIMTKYWKSYIGIENDGTVQEQVNHEMLRASNLAGQAINITRTTAAHAMSYKLTSLYGIAHGHAVALCLPKIWRYMLNRLDSLPESEQDHLVDAFQIIVYSTGCRTATEAVTHYEDILKTCDMQIPHIKDKEELNMLVQSVNPARLANNPVLLDRQTLSELYTSICFQIK